MFLDIMIIAIFIVFMCSVISGIFVTKTSLIIYLGVGFSPLILCLYRVYFHYFFAATLGKMAMKIKVVLLNGKKITFMHAMLRSGIDIFIHSYLLIIYIASFAYVMQSLNLNDWHGFEGIFPNWYSNMILYIFLLKHKILSLISVVWIIANIVLIFLNKRKRAIYDFIAKTIVINKN